MKKILFLIAMMACSSMFFAQQYSRELKYDSKQQMFGEDVIFVQQKLLELGIQEIGKADGWFNEKTLDAVETFQHFFGFEVTGSVNETIYNFLTSYETEPGLGNYVAAVKTACGLKYKKHHLTKKLDDRNLTSEGGYISACYNNRNGGIIPAYAVQNLYGEKGRSKNVYYPLSKYSYIYTCLNESYDQNAEYACYYVENNSNYLLKDGKLEDCGITEQLSVNPAHIYTRLKEGK